MGLPEPPPAGAPFLPADTFAGTTAIVTGAGTGLGRAIAVELARAGAAIGVVSRSEEHRLAGVAAVEAVGGRAAHAGADIREPDQIAEAFDAVEEALGPATILVNNAAANFPVLAAAMRPNAFRSVTNIVLDGTFFCSQELHRRLAARGRRAGRRHRQHLGHPELHGRARAWRTTPRPRRGWATSPSRWPWSGRPTASGSTRWRPGCSPTRTCATTSRRCAPKASPSTPAARPAGRLGRLHELGWAVTWLCSPYAAFVTGHTLVVDGANWLRRDFVMPEFTPVADQLSQVLRPAD